MAYVVCAKWTAKEGKEDRLAEICDEMTEPSRAEPGNLFYQAHRVTQRQEQDRRANADTARPRGDGRC